MELDVNDIIVAYGNDEKSFAELVESSTKDEFLEELSKIYLLTTQQREFLENTYDELYTDEGLCVWANAILHGAYRIRWANATLHGAYRIRHCRGDWKEYFKSFEEAEDAADEANRQEAEEDYESWDAFINDPDSGVITEEFNFEELVWEAR